MQYFTLLIPFETVTETPVMADGGFPHGNTTNTQIRAIKTSLPGRFSGEIRCLLGNIAHRPATVQHTTIEHQPGVYRKEPSRTFRAHCLNLP